MEVSLSIPEGLITRMWDMTVSHKYQTKRETCCIFKASFILNTYLMITALIQKVGGEGVLCKYALCTVAHMTRPWYRNRPSSQPLCYANQI